MGTIKTIKYEECPRCGTKSVGLEIIFAWFVGQARVGRHWYRHVADALGICGQCGRGILVVLRMRDEISATEHSEIPLTDGNYSRLLDAAPKPPGIEAPLHTPDNAAHFFKQGMDNLLGNWDAAGAMFRKSLEVGLREKFPDIKNNRLVGLINEAKEQGKLSEELADWAHRIRDLGNDASHEGDPFSQEEAEDMANFTKLLFQYIFTLPGEIRKYKGNDVDNTEDEGGNS